HPVPGRGRPARRSHRGAGPWPHRRRGHAGGTETAHPRCAHPPALRRRCLARRGRPSAGRKHTRRRGAGAPGSERGRYPIAARGAPYVDFLVPGILMMVVAGSCGPTAINVTMDMTGGFVDRIRSMAVTRGALLAGHVGGSVIRTLVATTAVTGVALLVGFRPKASVADWLAVVGIVVAFSFALAW